MQNAGNSSRAAWLHPPPFHCLCPLRALVSYFIYFFCPMFPFLNRRNVCFAWFAAFHSFYWVMKKRRRAKNKVNKLGLVRLVPLPLRHRSHRSWWSNCRWLIYSRLMYTKLTTVGEKIPPPFVKLQPQGQTLKANQIARQCPLPPPPPGGGGSFLIGGRDESGMDLSNWFFFFFFLVKRSRCWAIASRNSGVITPHLSHIVHLNAQLKNDGSV